METITVNDLLDSKNPDYKMIKSAAFIASNGVKCPSRMFPVSVEDVAALDLKVGDKVAVQF